MLTTATSWQSSTSLRTDVYQEVESCDCVDEETECSDARVQGEERIQQVLSAAGNASEQFAVSVITDATESCRTFTSVTQFYR